MKNLLTALALSLSINSFCQETPTNYQGSPLTNIGFRGGFVLDSTMRLLSYKGTPGGVDVMAINESGYVYLFSLDSAFSLISQVIIDTAEQLRDMDIDDIRKNGGMLTGDWDLNQNGKRVRFYGGKFEVDSTEVGDAKITNSLRYNAHTWDNYNEYSVPDVEWVQQNAPLFSNCRAADTTTDPAADIYCYTATQRGTYDSFLNSVGAVLSVDSLDLTKGEVKFVSAGDYWTKVVVPVDLSLYMAKSLYTDSMRAYGFQYTTTIDTLVENTPYSGTVIYNTHSAFSGQGGVVIVGSGQTVNRISVSFRTRANAVTKLAYALRNDSKSGQKIVADTLDLSIPALKDTIINIDLPVSIELNDTIYYQIAANQLIDSRGKILSALFTTPPYAINSYSISGSLDLDNFTNAVSNPTPWVLFSYVEVSPQPTAALSNHVAVNSPILSNAVTKVDSIFLSSSTALQDGYYEDNNEESFSEEMADYGDASLAVYGWGSTVGVGIGDGKNAVRLKFRARSDNATPITQVRVWITRDSKDGQVLGSKTLSTSIAAGEVADLIFKFDTEFDDDTLYLAFNANNKVDRYGLTGGATVPYPSPVYSPGAFTAVATPSTNSPSSYTYVVSPTSSNRNLWVEFMNATEGGVPTAGLVKKLREELSIDSTVLSQLVWAKIHMSERILAVVGKELNVYWKNIISSNLALSNLHIDVVSSKGAQYERFWRYTPTITDTGSTTLTFNVKFEGVTLSSHTCTLITKDTAKATGKAVNLLLIGDSNSDQCEPCKPLLDEGVSPDVTMIGTQGPVGRKTEGYSGYTVNYFVTEGFVTYKFIVSGVTTTPGISSVYSVGGVNYIVREINITGGTGNITCSGNSAPPSSGTLTRVSGTGDASVSYSSVETLIGNPFWIDDTLDFAQYLTDNSFTLEDTDVVVIALLTNDVFNGVSEALAESLQSDFETLIGNIRAAVPGINIILTTPPPPAGTQDAFAISYGNGRTMKEFESYWLWAVDFLNEYYDNSTKRDDHIYVLPVHAVIDRDYNMNTSTVPVNARNAATVTIQNNGVHPASSGQDQRGDLIKSSLIHLKQ